MEKRSPEYEYSSVDMNPSSSSSSPAHTSGPVSMGTLRFLRIATWLSITLVGFSLAYLALFRHHDDLATTCLSRHSSGFTRPLSSLPRISQDFPVVVMDTTIYDGLGNLYQDYSIVFENGIVREISKTPAVPPGSLVIDGRRQVVTPGLVDAHR